MVHSNLKINGYSLLNFVNLDSDELELVRCWRNDDRVRVWMFNDDPISKEEHEKFIINLKNANDRAYWLVKDDMEYIGVVYLVDILWKHRNAFLGIYANPQGSSRGRGSVLLSLLLVLSFDIMDLHSLRLKVIEDNRAAVNLYKKFGFKGEGRLREFLWRDGKWKDVIIMGMVNPREIESDR